MQLRSQDPKVRQLTIRLENKERLKIIEDLEVILLRKKEFRDRSEAILAIVEEYNDKNKEFL